MTDTHTDKDLQACTAFMSLAAWKSKCRTFMCELVLRESKVLYSAVLMVSHCMTQSCSSCWDNRPHTRKCTHKTHSRRLQHSREHGHANYFWKKMCLCQGQKSVVCSCRSVVKKLLPKVVTKVLWVVLLQFPLCRDQSTTSISFAACTECGS